MRHNKHQSRQFFSAHMDNVYYVRSTERRTTASQHRTRNLASANPGCYRYSNFSCKL